MTTTSTRTKALQQAQLTYYQRNKEKINSDGKLREKRKVYPFIENHEDIEIWRAVSNQARKLASNIPSDHKERAMFLIIEYLQTI